MKVLVYGAGAIGTYFGFRLSFNNEVVLITRGEHAKAINTSGLKVMDVDGTRVGAHVLALESIADLSPTWVPDFILVTTKAYDVEEAVDDILFHFEGLVKGGLLSIILLQNGLDNEERAMKAMSQYELDVALYRCLTSHGVVFFTPGEIHHRGEGTSTLGLYGIYRCGVHKEPLPEKDIDDLTLRIHMAFAASGLKVRMSKDINRDIWMKGIVNSAINPLTAILGVRNGELLRDDLRDIVRSVVAEGHSVASHLDTLRDFPPLDKVIGTVFEVIKNTENNRSSMLQDIEKGRRTEIEHINGAIVKKADELGIDVRVNRTLIRMVRYLERKV